jgi:hypothetical protein
LAATRTFTHFEVYPSLAAGIHYRNAVLTSQIPMPAAVARAVYSQAPGYSRSAEQFLGMTALDDDVFGENSAAQIARQTPLLRGDAALEYRGKLSVALGV